MTSKLLAPRYRSFLTVAAQVYPDEKETIVDAASRAGMSVSTWLRIAALTFARRQSIVDILAAAVRASCAFATDYDPDQQYAHEILDEAARRLTESLSEAERLSLRRIGMGLPGAGGQPLGADVLALEPER